MASIFKRDKKKKNAPYWIQYVDHTGKRKTHKGFTDKGLTEQLAAKLENEIMLRKSGLIDSDTEDVANIKSAKIESELKLYKEALSGKGNSSKHINLTIGRITRVLDGCGLHTVGQIDAGKVEVYLYKMRKKKNLGAKTFNHYAQALQSFGAWLVSKRKLVRNPLLGIDRLNTEADVRHKRRALNADEMAKLIAAARSSEKDVQCYSPELRAKLYIVAYGTGLRRKELASLTKSNFDLKASPPTVTVEAASSKHRKKDVLPLHPEVVALLTGWFDQLGNRQKLFPSLAKKKTWLMVKKDLELAEIPYKTDEGVADFHAAGRHSYVSGLVASGASITQVKELARHGDIRMTMRYTHVGMDEKVNALNGLEFPKEETATDDALHMRCTSGGSEIPKVSQDDTKPNPKAADNDPGANKNPCVNRGIVSECHLEALNDFFPSSGGGGDRTRVPRCIQNSLYVCSRLFLVFENKTDKRQPEKSSRRKLNLTENVFDVTHSDLELMTSS